MLWRAATAKADSELSEGDLQCLIKVQALVRGFRHRNSAKGIATMPHRTLKNTAGSMIHAERLKYQHFSKVHAQKVQEAKQKQKESIAARPTRVSSRNLAHTTGSATSLVPPKHKPAGSAPAVGPSKSMRGKVKTMALLGSTSSKKGLGRTGSSAVDHMDPKARVEHERGKITPAHRPCWWTPSQQKDVTATTAEAGGQMVRDRQLQMLRRATMQYFFSADQVRKILHVIDKGPKGSAHVEALVTLFACITDIERVDFPGLLGHVSYDKDGNHMIDWNELEELKKEKNAWVMLERRLGPANLFNPIVRVRPSCPGLSSAQGLL